MVILFGAGATRAAFAERETPPPLDADFFEISAQMVGRGTRRLAQKVMRDVYDLYGRVTGIGLEQYYRDIEARLDVSRFAKSKNRPMDWQTRTESLEELVRRVLVHTTCTLDDGPAKPLRSKIHQTILKHVKPGDTLITFNYDTVIEEAIETGFNFWTPKGGYGVHITGITHDWSKHWLDDRHIEKTKKSQIQLLKLHGSLNWVLYKTGNIRLKPRPYVVRSRSGKPVYDKAEILPPGWHKRVDRSPYNSIWRQARLKLEKCASLVIIGYSLPETDLIARALFLEVVRSRRANNNFIKELHVADISQSAKNRILDLFVPALGPTGVVFRYDEAKQLAQTWKPKP